MEKPNISHNIIKKIGKEEGFRNVDEVGYDYKNLETDKELEGDEIEERENGRMETFREIAKKEEIKGLIYGVDRNSKALTGRTPEKIEEETGVDKDIMFPPGGKILYVGDPWQRMGREIDDKRLVIIDYEFGDAASFVENEESFRNDIEWRGQDLIRKTKILRQRNMISKKDKEWFIVFEELIENAYRLSTIASFIKDGEKYKEDYATAAVAWTKARGWIEERYKKEKEEREFEDEEYGEPGDQRKELDDATQLRLDAWYVCIFGERGFRDIPDWNEVVLPQLETDFKKEERITKRKLTEEEIKNFIERKKKRYIEEIRLKKSPQKANVVEAIFPELPFKKNTFDRFVASWSLSAHLFAELDREGFDYCWKEILRVLTKEGEAYIFPLTYYFDDKRPIYDSLKAAENDGLLQWKLYNRNGREVPYNDDYDDAFTLWIGKSN